MINRPRRNVFILLSSHALPYAKVCIRTMLNNSVEPLRLRLVVDNYSEKSLIEAALSEIETPQDNLVEVVAKEEVQALLHKRFPGKKGLIQLHEGHPCWRKIIDPLVLCAEDEEFIVTDPDLYFPNLYSFEPTPNRGVMMMYQGPNCLLPPAAVRSVFDMGVKLANHVDIGVAQMRVGALDLDWLDWLVLGMDVERFRHFMHIEAIIWSTIAMKIGGEHLNPYAWKCWQRGHIKRVAVALGVPGKWTLKLEPLAQMKCIHVSGKSKWWVTESLESGFLKETRNRIDTPTQGVAYRELTKSYFEREQKLKTAAKKLGYYKLTKSA